MRVQSFILRETNLRGRCPINPMPAENWFRRSARFNDNSAKIPSDTMPDGLAVKCAKCGEIIFNKDFERNLKVCVKCGHHHRLSSDDRISYTVNEGSFKEFPSTVALKSRDFLEFPDYQDKLEKAWAKIGAQDSFRAGTASIDNQPLVLGVSEFAFMGGSMGSVTGEKIAIAMEEAIKRQLPVVLFTTSGGARMQEGLMSLMQMAKTSAACARLAQAGLPLIIVLTDPTTAGVMASYASLGDVLLSEPGALVAFTGQRVAAQAAQGHKLPHNYQLSEWRTEMGHIDAVVPRREMRSTLGKLIGLLTPEPITKSKPRNSTSSNGSKNGNGNGNGKNHSVPQLMPTETEAPPTATTS